MLKKTGISDKYLDDIDVSSERHLEGNDLLNMLNEDDRPSRVDRSSSSTSSLSSVILPPIRTGEVTSINYYFLIAVLVALLSFVVYLLMKTVSS